jgi:hypothetical protein
MSDGMLSPYSTNAPRGFFGTTAWHNTLLVVFDFQELWLSLLQPVIKCSRLLLSVLSLESKQTTCLDHAIGLETEGRCKHKGVNPSSSRI